MPESVFLADKKIPLRIAYVSLTPHSDMSNWSGTTYHIAQALERVFESVVFISAWPASGTKPLLHRFGHLPMRLKERIYGIAGKLYRFDFDPAHLAYSEGLVQSQLAAAGPIDAIIGPAFQGGTPLSILRTEIPIVTWDDATIASNLDRYFVLTNLCAETKYYAQKYQAAILSKAAMSLFSSQWAADSAIKHYGVPSEKVKVVPFGANFADLLPETDVQKFITARSRDTLKLLFVGQDQKRKGVDKAINVAERLRELGVNCFLSIVGSANTSELPAHVTNYGRLDKRVPGDLAKLQSLFAESHFLVHPAQVESYGMVIVEASGFGLPSIVSDVDGIPVRGGINGQRFPLNSFVENAADYMLSTWKNSSDYEALCRSSRREAVETLNWDAAGNAVGKIIQELVQKNKTLAAKPVN